MDRTNSLNEQLTHRTAGVEDTANKIYQAQGDISKLKSMIHGLDLEISNYEKLNSRLVDEQKTKLATNSSLYNKAHELTSQL